MLKTVDEGTAKKAYISGFSSGGKTGTAEIWDIHNKEYSKQNIFLHLHLFFQLKTQNMY